MTVTVTQPGDSDPKTAPVVVVAQGERDAEVVAAKAVGPDARAETLRVLTDQEILEYGLDLQAHGSARALPILNL